MIKHITRTEELDHKNAGWLRALVLLLGSLETVAFVAFAGLMLRSTDPIGRSIGEGLTAMLAVPLAALVVPALWLAYRRQRVPLALALVIAAPLIAGVLWRIA